MNDLTPGHWAGIIMGVFFILLMSLEHIFDLIDWLSKKRRAKK